MGLIGTLQDLLHARLVGQGGAPSPATGPDDRHGVVASSPVDSIRPAVDRTDSPLGVATFTLEEWFNTLARAHRDRLPNVPRGEVSVSWVLDGRTGALTVTVDKPPPRLCWRCGTPVDSTDPAEPICDPCYAAVVGHRRRESP